MNCKPGDLAVFVGGCHPANVGRLCEVLEPSRSFDGRATWLVRMFRPSPRKYSGTDIDGTPATVGCALDDHLRPIRDPGEDATDETLLWLPSPTKEVA